MRIDGTRVTLDTVVHAFNEGHTAEKIWIEIESASDYQIFRERLLARRRNANEFE